MKTNNPPVSLDKRFSFGRNWLSFIRTLDENRILEAERSLAVMLDLTTLAGKRFLDVGCGSGLFSLAARRLGAKVFSFDFDKDSVEATKELKRRYFPHEDHMWHIEQGDVLRESYLNKLDRYDIVYAWGVLHHTGDLFQAMDNVSNIVKNNGKLFIAIYNDKGISSRIWYHIKKFYSMNAFASAVIKALFYPVLFSYNFVKGFVHNKDPFYIFKHYKSHRGMSILHDWNDWLGGYPFEVAKPSEVISFFSDRHFRLEHSRTVTGSGNNEFIFWKCES